MSDTSRARGPYAKGTARRREIIEHALRVFARGGFHSGSLREIARSVGMTVPGVLHHFADKEELFQAVLAERDARVAAAAGEVGEATLLEQIRAVVAFNQSTRGMTSLYTVVSAEATEPDHPAHDDFRRRYADRAAATAPVLEQARRDGLVRADLDVDAAARLIPAVMDGLQLQWLLEPDFDMTAAFDEFVRGYLLPRP